MEIFRGTKGKWVFNNECVITTEKNIIGNIICDNPTHSLQSTLNWEANAKLISCAPEMLEMLIRIKSYQTREDEYVIEQLIKKATTI